jgi:hypothetical protein
MAVTMVIEVTGMTILTVFAANFCCGAALEGTVGCGIMTGCTCVAAMNIGAANKWGAGGSVMAVDTETNGKSGMTMCMTIEVSSMTSQTRYSCMRSSTDSKPGITVSVSTIDGGSGAAAGVVMTRRTSI